LVLFGADEGSELEQVTEEDRAYNESCFSEVRDAIFANPYQKVWGGEGEPALPRLNLLNHHAPPELARAMVPVASQ